MALQPTHTYHYDSLGRLHSDTGPHRVTRWQWDDDAQPTPYTTTPRTRKGGFLMALDSTLAQIATTVAGSVAAVYAGLPWLLGKTNAASTLHTVATVCEKVVASLEQTQGAASGVQKKALALDLVNTVLSAMKIKAPAPFIDAAVEAAVLGLSLISAPAKASAAPPSPPEATAIPPAG